MFRLKPKFILKVVNRDPSILGLVENSIFFFVSEKVNVNNFASSQPPGPPARHRIL